MTKACLELISTSKFDSLSQSRKLLAKQIKNLLLMLITSKTKFEANSYPGLADNRPLKN